MKVEVWSPDGLEASAYGDLAEVVEGENTKAVGLLDTAMGCRVWLTEDECDWLVEVLAARSPSRTERVKDERA